MHQGQIVSIEPLDSSLIEQMALSGVDVRVMERTDNIVGELERINPEVLICRDRDCVSEIVKRCSNIKFIYIVEVGVEELPFRLLVEKDIRVANTSGISADIMSNYVLACILGQCVRVKENLFNQQQKHWKRYQCTDSLQKKKLLIVGAGRTGKEIARKAKIFGMETIGVQRTPKPSSCLDKVISEDEMDAYLSIADYVVCTIPQTPRTERMFDEQRFGLMKKESVFINISRGAIVVERDLLEVLDSGKIQQVYLDVFDKEPLPIDNPLWNHPKVQITPHQSGRLVDFMSRAMEMFVENYHAFIQGETMPNEVNLQQGY